MGGRKLVFRNIAGIWRQDKEFWKFVGKHDYICLSETWVEEKGWRSLKNRLPNTHTWDYSKATRIRKRAEEVNLSYD